MPGPIDSMRWRRSPRIWPLVKLAAEDPSQFINLSFETERYPYYLVAGVILAKLFVVEIANVTNRRDSLFCLLDVVGIESPNCLETAFGGHHLYLFILLQACIEGASPVSQRVLQHDREMKPAGVCLSFLQAPFALPPPGSSLPQAGSRSERIGGPRWA